MKRHDPEADEMLMVAMGNIFYLEMIKLFWKCTESLPDRLRKCVFWDAIRDGYPIYDNPPEMKSSDYEIPSDLYGDEAFMKLAYEKFNETLSSSD